MFYRKIPYDGANPEAVPKILEISVFCIHIKRDHDRNMQKPERPKPLVARHLADFSTEEDEQK